MRGDGCVYILGDRTGRDIKIGQTARPQPGHRGQEVNRDQMNGDSYVLLAAVRGNPTSEKNVKRAFEHLRLEKGRKTEYFQPAVDLVEYVNWLRRQYWVAHDEWENIEDLPLIPPEMWLPSPERRVPRPLPDPTQLVQPWETAQGPLTGTAWNWMITGEEGIQDYFTPSDIIDAAREAMGDIDLDAASHWMANRVHRIPEFFDVTRSAFDNDWHGRVWLNPPYGDNAPWLERVERYVLSGAVTQLCMLSPLWAFTTATARPVMRLSSAAVILTPTPRFWGNKDKTKTGSNHPHAIIYIGPRHGEFVSAFAPMGIPVRVAWDQLDGVSSAPGLTEATA